MSPTTELQKTVYDEMIGRIKEDDATVPEKIDQYIYYDRTEKGKNYPIYCRKLNTENASEEILLDANAMAEGKAYFSIGDFAVSDNHGFLAFTVDEDGSETYNLYIKDLTSGEFIGEPIEKIGDDAVWAADNNTVFYTILDEAHRPHQIYRVEKGQTKEEAVLVFEEKDQSYYLGIGRSRSQQFLFITATSSITYEWWSLDANNPTGDFSCVAKKKHGVEYLLDHHGDYFYIIHNSGNQNFQLDRTRIDNSDWQNWEPVLAERKSVMLSGIDAFFQKSSCPLRKKRWI